MTHYLIELALWIAVAYVIGCVIGYLLRRMFATEPAAQAIEPQRQTAPAALAPEPEAAAPVEPVTALAEPVMAPVAASRMDRPRGLAGPRNGKPDNLQRISGIGPKNEKILHSLGFFHFDQISVWTAEHVAWVDDHLRFNGRIGREKWIEQADLLASGAGEEFNRRFGPKP